MSLPWLKKNPFMSMWLSAANRAAGSARGAATAQIQAQGTAALTAATNESIKLWSAAVAPPAPRSRTKRKPARPSIP